MGGGGLFKCFLSNFFLCPTNKTTHIIGKIGSLLQKKVSDHKRDLCCACLVVSTEQHAMSTPPPAIKVAILTTSATTFGKNKKGPTGVWLEELATPYYALKSARCAIDVYSIDGGPIPIDEASRGEGFYTEDCERFDADDEAQSLLKKSKPLKELDDDAYDGIFLPGGRVLLRFPRKRPFGENDRSVYEHEESGRVGLPRANRSSFVQESGRNDSARSWHASDWFFGRRRKTSRNARRRADVD